MGGPGNLDKLACLALIGPRSATWGSLLGMKRKSRGLGGLSVPLLGGFLEPTGLCTRARAAVQKVFALTF